jgi:beta-glucosidase
MLLLLSSAASLPIYLDPRRPIPERVQDLVDNMTLEEKVGQLQQIDGHFDIVGPFKSQNPGSVLSLLGPATAEALELAGETRLRIPVLMGIDAIHGNAFLSGATVFPVQLGAAASWDARAVEMQGNITAYEMRYAGVAWTFSPVLCIARDARWGRVDETFGEDPLLIGRLAAALVRGLQGAGGVSADPDKVMATAKHYAGYSETEGGRDASEADLSRRKLASWFLPPFAEAVRARVGAFMTGYQAIDGLPSTANAWLLRSTLKGEWGFGGFLVTDYNNVGWLVENQKIVATYAEAAALAVSSGNDMIMGTPAFYQGALDAVAAGTLNVSLIDEAVRRILTAKFKLGLFEDPRWPNATLSAARIGSPFSRAQAQKTAEESLILLENDGTLPLDASKLGTVGVIGPNADNPLQQSGDWSLGSHQFNEHPRNCTVTVLDGIREIFTNGKVLYEKGAGIEPGEKGANLTAAIEIVKSSDISIVVIGDRLMYYGESRSTGTLELMGTQKDFLAAIIATGKKFVLVVIASKPLVIDEEIRRAAAAVIWQFCPGMLGGRATAKALFGQINPCGRLPITIPRHVGQLPVYYQRIRGEHGGYADIPEAPAYAVGYGLGYSSVTYVASKVDKSSYRVGENVTVTVIVRNDGVRDAVEVVQVYVTDVVTSTTWAAIELKGFARIEVPAGRSVTATITISVSDLSIVNKKGDRVVEPGEFDIKVAKASDNVVWTGRIIVTG